MPAQEGHTAQVAIPVELRESPSFRGVRDFLGIVAGFVLGIRCAGGMAGIGVGWHVHGLGRGLLTNARGEIGSGETLPFVKTDMPGGQLFRGGILQKRARLRAQGIRSPKSLSNLITCRASDSRRSAGYFQFREKMIQKKRSIDSTSAAGPISSLSSQC